MQPSYVPHNSPQNSNQSPAVRASLVEVCIPTATAIIVNSIEPNLVLVGKSKKHPLPVMPGGKIDATDIGSVSLEAAASRCIIREIFEETRLVVDKVELFELRTDPERDIRLVSAGALRGTLAEVVVQNLPEDQVVLGRYGVPDYVFIVKVDPREFSDTEELKDLSWIDSRFVASETLSAGHGDIVMRYAAVTVPKGTTEHD